MAENVLNNIINAIFKDRSYLESITYETAKQNIFMVNRRMAIKYPDKAQLFNNSKINPLDTIKFWGDYLGGTYAQWIYTPGASKSKANAAKGKVGETLKKKYVNRYGVTLKDIDAWFKFFPEEAAAEFKAFEKFLKDTEKQEE